MTVAPPEVPGTLRPLDLAQPKDVGALITSAWRVWSARPKVFLLIAVLVAFVPLAALGALGVSFRHDHHRDAMNAVSAARSVLQATLITWIVSATHARAVVALAAGEDLSAGEATRRGLSALARVAWVAVLAALAVAAGFLLLIVGAFWIATLVTFAVPIAAVTEERGWKAVRASARLVRQVGWWRTLGNNAVIGLVGAAIAFGPGIVVAIIGGALAAACSSDETAIRYALQTLLAAMQAVIFSWTALASTLLYFSHRARTREPWELPPGSAPAVDLVRRGPEPAGGTPTFARPGHVAPAPGESQGPRFDPPSRR